MPTPLGCLCSSWHWDLRWCDVVQLLFRHCSDSVAVSLVSSSAHWYLPTLIGFKDCWSLRTWPCFSSAFTFREEEQHTRIRFLKRVNLRWKSVFHWQSNANRSSNSCWRWLLRLPICACTVFLILQHCSGPSYQKGARQNTGMSLFLQKQLVEDRSCTSVIKINPLMVYPRQKQLKCWEVNCDQM